MTLKRMRSPCDIGANLALTTFGVRRADLVTHRKAREVSDMTLGSNPHPRLPRLKHEST